MDINVVDNLTTNDPYSALSAKQGKVLYDMITDVATDAEIDAIFA